MDFDQTLTLSTVIQLAVYVIGAGAVVATLRAEMRAVTARISRLETLVDVMEKSMAVLAVQEDRLNAFARRLERLEGRLLEGPFNHGS